MNRNKLKVITVAVAAVVLSSLGNSQAASIQLDYVSLINGEIMFDGAGDFLFGQAGGPGLNSSLRITTVLNGPGAPTAENLYGNISGWFHIGAITTFGSLQSAPVTTNPLGVAPKFIIHDGSGFDLVSDLALINMTINGSAGGINTLGVINMTGMTYSGTNPDLLALKGALGDQAISTLTFQFSPAMTLEQLKSAPGKVTSYSGSISTTLADVPDGGTTLALMGMALLGLGVARRKLQTLTQ